MTTISPADWSRLQAWWLGMGSRLQVEDRVQAFFDRALGAEQALPRAAQMGAQPEYILFVLLRYWIPVVLPPAGRERVTKGDPDYWLESEQLLKAAVERLRELKPLIELLTSANPVGSGQGDRSRGASPVVEVELANMLQGIAEVAGSYGGPDYTSVIKQFDPVPLRQTQPFKHNKKNSAELWVVFLLREHFRSLGLGKDRYWPLVAGVCAAAGIVNPNGQAYQADELKSWWQKNWPRTYTQLEQTQSASEVSGAAYQQDFDWFVGWVEWQRSR
ncbi:MAG: hypothetical protein KF814_08810 [Nitrospiraceae bacterium]|nr:hypothetical protein [Nitrospiraceae bacterium]